MLNRKTILLLLKLLVSAVLILVLVKRISGQEIRSALDQPQWELLAAAVFVFLISALGGALQWLRILAIANLSIGHRDMFRLYFVGLFFNNFLLGNIGGDVVKIYDLGRRQDRVKGVLCGTILDRIIGLCGLTLLALLAVPAAWLLDIQLPPLRPLLLSMVIWLVALSLLLSRRLSSILKRLLLSTPLRGLVEKASLYSSEFRVYRQHPGALARIGVLTLLVQTLRVTTHVLIAAGLGITLDPGRILQLFVLVPLLGILVALPISINGLGVREIAAASLFVSVGVVATEADAVAVEALAYGAMVLVSIIGGVLFFVDSRRGDRNYPASGL